MSDDAGIAPNAFIQDLLAKMQQPKKVEATYRFCKGPDGPDEPYPLVDLLEVSSDDLSPAASRALIALEGLEGYGADWTDLKWKLTALDHVQDIFDCLAVPSANPLLMLQQYYFYYESRHLLSESILCGLNGFTAAAQALLRPFLEFSILQNYYYRNIAETRSYAALHDYFRTRNAPATSTVVKRAMSHDEFTKPIRFRLHTHLGGLSETTLHPYHPEHSPRQHQMYPGEPSFEGLHFWYTTRLVLEAALWVYYVNFPLLFRPVDVVRRFGCNGPVGIFIDQQGGACVKRSLNQGDYERFAQYSNNNSDARAKLEWFTDHSELTDDEIAASWNRDEHGEFPGVEQAYGHSMARMRSMRKILAAWRPPDDAAEFSPEIIKASRSLEGWKRMSTRFKKG